MQAGTAVARESSDPSYGIYAYTGREWDPEVGLYYYRARYYDPKVGRFIGEDPISFEGGVNFYSYVHSNPTNFVDPAGLLVPAAPVVVAGWKVAAAATAAAAAWAWAAWEAWEASKGVPPEPGPTPSPQPDEQCDKGQRGCRPCIPPVGTRAYRADTDPSSRPHAGIPPPHWQMYEMHQAPLDSPQPCKCFWKKLKNVFGPGSAPPTGEPQMGPAAGGGPA